MQPCCVYKHHLTHSLHSWLFIVSLYDMYSFLMLSSILNRAQKILHFSSQYLRKTTLIIYLPMFLLTQMVKKVIFQMLLLNIIIKYNTNTDYKLVWFRTVKRLNLLNIISISSISYQIFPNIKIFVISWDLIDIISLLIYTVGWAPVLNVNMQYLSYLLVTVHHVFSSSLMMAMCLPCRYMFLSLKPPLCPVFKRAGLGGDFKETALHTTRGHATIVINMEVRI